jgi:hypothetical protein
MLFLGRTRLFWEPNKTKTHTGSKPDFLNVKAAGRYGYLCAVND